MGGAIPSQEDPASSWERHRIRSIVTTSVLTRDSDQTCHPILSLERRGRTTGHLVPGCGLQGNACLWAAREPEFRASQLCCVDRQPGVGRNRSRFFTQNLFGKMADILEKIKK